MKLVNRDEEIPKYFYIFLHFNDGITGWVHKNNFDLDHKIRSGAILNGCALDGKYLARYMDGTQKYAPFIPSPTEEVPISPTSFSLNIAKDYAVEYNVEMYRHMNVGKYPSRFSAIYAFGDYETCKVVSAKYGWNLNNVRKFKLYDDESLKLFYRISKHNMEIISYLRGIDSRNFSTEDQGRIYKHYWDGEGNLDFQIDGKKYSSGEIYEYLIEGVLELVDSNED